MFDNLAHLADQPRELLDRAAQALVEAGELHELFKLRLLEHRFELGLPAAGELDVAELDAGARRRLEDAYLDACREVGELLLESGQARAAWSYLRPAGERRAMRRWLERAVATDAIADELIELALYQAIDAERGFAWLLARRGTCNAITELEGLTGQLDVADQTACAALLVRHVHDELLAGLHAHLERIGKPIPAGRSIPPILDASPELLAEGAYHVDTSHLAATVRHARTLTERHPLTLAVELAEYGSRLDASLQYADGPPFEPLYPTHLQFFRAQLGTSVDEAIAYFAEQARSVDAKQFGTTAIESYLILLARLDRAEEALEAYEALTDATTVLSPYCPTLLTLAQASGQWQRYQQICRDRNDLVAAATGWLARG